MVETIEETINSVINQRYRNLEYIIIDGGSTDGTIDIVEKYVDQIALFISEPDSGMYDALNKGLQKCTGEIMMWINADDLLVPNALKLISKVFEEVPSVKWIQGFNSFVDKNGLPIPTIEGGSFSRLNYYKFNYKWIQQESTVWRRSLWVEAGGNINTELKYAGDLELWCRFFEYAKLYNTSFPIGAFRKREGQLSEAQLDKYLEEAERVRSKMKLTEEDEKAYRKIQLIKKLQKITSVIKIGNGSLENKIAFHLKGEKVHYDLLGGNFFIN